MSKFIKGDKVVAKDVGTNKSITQGSEYVVAALETGGVRVINDNGDEKYYHGFRFEKVAAPSVATVNATPNLSAGNFGTGKGTTAKLRDFFGTRQAAYTASDIGDVLGLPGRQLNKRLVELERKGVVSRRVIGKAVHFQRVKQITA